MRAMRGCWLCLVLLLPGAAAADWTGWSFDWARRTDGDGLPAGRYEVTPFPITETSTSYLICNDEHPAGRTYELGAKSFVDGGYGGGGSDGSWSRPWTTIGAAIAAVAAGNATIVVRGAHDAFDGVYAEAGLTLKSGVDDTHRWTIVGYGQERPVISLASDSDSTIVAAGAVTYATIQRVRIAGNNYNGIRTSGDDTFISVIDVWLYDNCRWDPALVNADGSTGGTHADGNLYFLGSDHCWIYHTTSERSGGHGFKVGDDADDDLVEWSVARESGYWAGTTITDRSHAGQGHPTSCDFPNDGTDSDGDTVPDYGDNLTVRYNICATSVFEALQLRRVPNFDVHHNEILDSPHFGDVYIDNRNAGVNQVIIFGAQTYGRFYANLLRSPGTGKQEPMYRPDEGLGAVDAINVGANPGAAGELLIFNNLIYGHDAGSAIAVGYTEESYSNIRIYNNSIHSVLNDTSWGTGVFTVDDTFWASGSTLEFVNNVLYLAGAGNCTEWFDHEGDVAHERNIYFHPAGGLGFAAAALGAGELETDPLWAALPAGEYDAAFAALTEASPAVDSGSDLAAWFTSAFNATIRPQGAGWDRGAYEYPIGGSPDADADAGSDADADAVGDADADVDTVGDADGGDGADAAPPDTSGGGCGCRATAVRAPHPALAIIFLAAWVWLRRAVRGRAAGPGRGAPRATASRTRRLDIPRVVRPAAGGVFVLHDATALRGEADREAVDEVVAELPAGNARMLHAPSRHGCAVHGCRERAAERVEGLFVLEHLLLFFVPRHHREGHDEPQGPIREVLEHVTGAHPRPRSVEDELDPFADHADVVVLHRQQRSTLAHVREGVGGDSCGEQARHGQQARCDNAGRPLFALIKAPRHHRRLSSRHAVRHFARDRASRGA